MACVFALCSTLSLILCSPNFIFSVSAFVLIIDRDAGQRTTLGMAFMRDVVLLVDPFDNAFANDGFVTDMIKIDFGIKKCYPADVGMLCNVL